MSETETPDVLMEEGEPRKAPGWIPLAAVLLVTMAGGGFVGATALGPKLGPALAARAEAGAKKGGGHGGEGEASTIHLVDNLVVNPASSGGSRFLLTSIAIETASADEAGEVRARDLEIRDAFNRILGSKTVDQLSDLTERRKIVGELMDSVARIIGPGIAHRILIPQFVIQ